MKWGLRMKKIVLTTLLLSTLVFGGCTSNEKKDDQTKSSQKTSEKKTSNSSEEVTSGKLTFDFETNYEKGTIGYDWDYYAAKSQAISKVNPKEYSDFQFIITHLQNFTPATITYLNNADATNEEINTEYTKVEENVAQAKAIQKEVNKIEKTENNADEYEKLNSLLKEAIANEGFLQ